MGNFLIRVRQGQVAGPRRRTFTPERWTENYSEFSSGDIEDVALYNSGLYIHSKLQAIRDATQRSSLNALSTETRVKAFLAVANHQFEALQYQLRKQLAEASASDSKEFHVRDLAKTQIRHADGNSYNVDAALGSMLDAIAIPVRFTLAKPLQVANDTLKDVRWTHVQAESFLAGLYDQAEHLWEDCVWNTYSISNVADQMLATPVDPHAKRGTRAAEARKFTLSIEATSYAARVIQSQRTAGLEARIKQVQAVETEGEQQRIQLGEGKLDLQNQSMLLALRTMACPPYYDSLIEEPQPLLAGSSLSQLFDGWMVIAQAAGRMWNSLSEAHQFEIEGESQAASDMNEYIPFFVKTALVQAVHEATDMPMPKALAIVDFLTFRGKSSDELWTQPLVGIGDSIKLYPVFGAITAPDLRHVLERWMAQLKVKLEERGPAFEDYLRSALARCATTSPILAQVARVVPKDYTFRCADTSFAQIDALFCIGSQVFVLEAKCILEPTESTSIGTHRLAIEHAVEQAQRRVNLIMSHRGEFILAMAQFGWTLPSDFNVHPLVAVSTVACVGFPVSGVPIVDEYVLGKYFEGGYQYVGLNPGDLTVLESSDQRFYSSAREAEANAADYFQHPPQLKQYSDALHLKHVPLYRASKKDWFGVIEDYEQR